jgi:hypothetical protein
MKDQRGILSPKSFVGSTAASNQNLLVKQNIKMAGKTSTEFSSENVSCCDQQFFPDDRGFIRTVLEEVDDTFWDSFMMRLNMFSPAS